MMKMYKWYKYESIHSPIEWHGYIYKSGWLIYTGDDILITVGLPAEKPEHIIDGLWRD